MPNQLRRIYLSPKPSYQNELFKDTKQPNPQQESFKKRASRRLSITTFNIKKITVDESFMHKFQKEIISSTGILQNNYVSRRIFEDYDMTQHVQQLYTLIYHRNTDNFIEFVTDVENKINQFITDAYNIQLNDIPNFEKMSQGYKTNDKLIANYKQSFDTYLNNILSELEKQADNHFVNSAHP